MSELEKPNRLLQVWQKLLSLNIINKKAGVFAGVIAIVVLSATFIFFQNKNKDDAEKVLGINNISLNDVKDLVGKVGMLAALPAEVPSVATVSDISKLSNQSFFASAQNGDKVLIFKDSNKAVIYRPTTNKIIAYDTISFEQPTPVPDLTNTATPSGTTVSITPSQTLQKPTVTIVPSPSATE